MLLFGSILNLFYLLCFKNVWHLPLLPLNMSDWMEYVKCVCNFKLQRRLSSLEPFCHCAITDALFPNWSENSPGHTYLLMSLLRSTSITLPHPFSYLTNSFSLSLLIFYLHLTYILVSPATTVHFFPLLSQSLCFLFDWISLSCFPLNVWFFNEWNAIPSRCHHSSDTK